MTLMSERLRETAPSRVESCFPDPIHEIIVVEGKHYLQGYLPWFEKRARKDIAGLRYNNVDLKDVEGCASAPAIVAMQRPKRFSWCRGCDGHEAFFVLQSMTSTVPGVARNWAELANLMALGAEEIVGFKVALGCLAISLRLLRCLGVPPKDVSWDHLGELLAAAKRLHVELPPNGQTSTWIEETMLAKATTVFNTVRAALTPQKEGFTSLMPEERVALFVDAIMHCAEPEHAHRFSKTTW